MEHIVERVAHGGQDGHVPVGWGRGGGGRVRRAEAVQHIIEWVPDRMETVGRASKSCKGHTSEITGKRRLSEGGQCCSPPLTS